MERSESIAGESIGITIYDPLFIERGEVICDQKPMIRNELKATIFWMDRNDLKQGEKLNLRCATQEVRAEIIKIERVIDSSTLEEKEAMEVKQTEIADIRMKLNKPIVTTHFSDVPEFGRFVLEKEDVVAGGIFR